MPKIIRVNGTIVSNNLQRIYDWIGIEATSPSKVINSLPSDDSAIEIYINSGGGDVFAGSEIYTALRDYKGHVTTKNVGIAASSASVILQGGDTRLSTPTGQIMIHNVTTGANGDYRTFEHAAEVLKSANQAIANAYKRTGKSDEEIKALMDKETWYNAQTALEHGFIDEIMFEEKEQNNGLYVANAGATLLGADAINKILQIMDSEKKKTITVEESKIMKAQLELLQLGGIIHG